MKCINLLALCEGWINHHHHNLLPRECKILVDYIIKIRLGSLSVCSSISCWHHMKKIYQSLTRYAKGKSHRWMRRISLIIIAIIVVFSASGYMFIRWILLFFSSQPNKSTTSLEELDDNALPHDDDDNSSIQQDSNTPPLHHSPKDCILFLDQVKAHLQTSIMNEFFSSPIGGDEWPWNQQNQHHLMRAVVSVVQVFCLANMMSRILSSCLCNNNSTMDKVLDEVEHTFSDLVIARCVQQM